MILRFLYQNCKIRSIIDTTGTLFEQYVSTPADKMKYLVVNIIAVGKKGIFNYFSYVTTSLRKLAL